MHLNLDIQYPTFKHFPILEINFCTGRAKLFEEYGIIRVFELKILE